MPGLFGVIGPAQGSSGSHGRRTQRSSGAWRSDDLRRFVRRDPCYLSGRARSRESCRLRGLESGSTIDSPGTSGCPRHGRGGGLTNRSRRDRRRDRQRHRRKVRGLCLRSCSGKVLPLQRPLRQGANLPAPRRLAHIFLVRSEGHSRSRTRSRPSTPSVWRSSWPAGVPSGAAHSTATSKSSSQARCSPSTRPGCRSVGAGGPPKSSKVRTPLDEARFVERFIELLRTTVNASVRQSPRLGISLTGGLDSRMVMASLEAAPDGALLHLRKHVPGQPRTSRRPRRWPRAAVRRTP